MSLPITVDYSIQGMTLPLPLDGASFSIIDSLNSFYNRATMSIPDSTGFFQEAFLNAIGSVHHLKVSQDDAIVESEYVIQRRLNEEPVATGGIAGITSFNLVQRWMADQPNSSMAYTGTISSIVDKLSSRYFPRRTDIDSTGNKGTWLQANDTDAYFIQTRLLPNAHSPTYEGAPFFAWCGNDNKFHFKNFEALWGNSGHVEAELYYSKNQASSNPAPDNTNRNRNSIFDIKVLTGTPTDHSKLIISNWVSLVDGTSAHAEAKHSEGALVADNLILPRVFSTVPTSKSLGLFRKGMEDNFKGQQADQFRDSLLIYKLFLLIPLNLKLNSGKKVNVTIAANPDIDSTAHSGEYLIELAEHVWSHKERTGYTKLLLGRGAQSVPDGVSMKSFMPTVAGRRVT